MAKNKIYTHTGQGHYVGSTIIVYAASKEEAESLIKSELIACGLIDEALDVDDGVTLKPNSVVYSYDGDY